MFTVPSSTAMVELSQENSGFVVAIVADPVKRKSASGNSNPGSVSAGPLAGFAIDFRSWQALRDVGFGVAEAAAIMTKMIGAGAN